MSTWDITPNNNQPCRNNFYTNAGMSYYNNSSSYYAASASGPEVQNLFPNSAQGSYNEDSQRSLVHNSTLEPNAPEFRPLNQAESSSNQGAIKKKPQNQQNYNSRRNNRYGSGRIFNNSRDQTRTDRRNDDRNDEEVENVSYFSNYKHDYGSSSVDNPNSNARVKEHTRKQYHKKGVDYQNEKYSNKSYDNRTEYSDASDGNRQSVGRNFKSKNYDKSNHFYEKSYHRSSNHYERNDTEGGDRYRNSNQKFYKGEYRGGSGKYYEGKRQPDSDNWRKPRDATKMDKNPKELSESQSNKKLDAASQKERLEQMLNRRQLECLVCYEKIKNSHKVWSCEQCYNIFHLNCTIVWAKMSKPENNWRCPICQYMCTKIPNQYKCYCGKTIDPKLDAGIIPHSCGEMCLRKGRTCEHKCTLQCHPGPCPDCNVMVAKRCGCGATQATIKCCSDLDIVCDATCNKTLECGLHTCKAKCHSGPCAPCEKTLTQECHCGKVGRRIACTKEINGATTYSCGEVCGKLLTCSNHKCESICHEGPCDVCPMDITIVKSCPCGKSQLDKPRTSCLDPVPCCDKICGKALQCGQPSCPHVCKTKCHIGECPPCRLTTFVRCRCGHMDKELPCQQLTSKADDARCEKKCVKKRLCGKHRCNQRCCIELEHFCPLPCNHQLSCGQHRCVLTCHSGRCPPCLETSFEELYCECGASVLYPPIPCGTKPPSCNKPCSRQRPCGHEINHSCHTGPCPPCTVLCKRWCYGHHQQRSTIPCHQEEFSCGLPCDKKMSCGRHKCTKPCHGGECPLPCKQPCTVARQLCGHPCGRPCHDSPCPPSVCKFNVPLTCQCGLQKSSKPCVEVADEFKYIEMAQLQEKMGDLARDMTVDLTDIIKQKKSTVLKSLECTEECRVLERNRRLAIGLQIRNPDLSQKLTPRYSDFMRNWAKKDPHFCQKVHYKLSDLVQLSKQSKQKSRSYSFESMNRDKRHFIHEYCEHFGCESAAYDMEPNRNIVATANKDKSWLPSMSLLEVIQRENGQRKVPGPVLSKSSTTKNETVSLKLPGRGQRASTPPGEPTDPFDD